MHQHFKKRRFDQRLAAFHRDYSSPCTRFYLSSYKREKNPVSKNCETKFSYVRITMHSLAAVKRRGFYFKNAFHAIVKRGDISIATALSPHAQYVARERPPNASNSVRSFQKTDCSLSLPLSRSSKDFLILPDNSTKIDIRVSKLFLNPSSMITFSHRIHFEKNSSFRVKETISFFTQVEIL